MRWEDMSQKDNAMKLSLQGVDFRLSMLEELALQNTEILKQLKGFMSQYDTRSRNVSASSDRSGSHCRLDSEESTPDQGDLQQFVSPSPSDAESGGKEASATSLGETSLTPSSSMTMRSMPSPILVHSRKAQKDDNLQPKSAAKSSYALTRRLERQASLKQRRSLPKVLEHDTTPDEDLGKQSLSERRHASKLHIDTNLTAPDSENNTTSSTDVLDKADTDVNNSSALYSTAHMGADTQVSTHVPAKIGTDDSTTDAPGLLMKSKSYESPLMVQIPGVANNDVPVSFASPFTPILTSLRAEYTTITDAIDTTCMINRTPPRSPTSAHPYYNEGMWDEDLSEHATLKQAEEQERRKMEKVIRHRLRQISMDESDSISDIAKLAISEMDVTDDPPSEHEDDDLHNDTANVHIPTLFKEAEMSHEDSGPVTFDAVEIRIRRASSNDTESHVLESTKI